MTHYSALDFFSVGIGPSSSHTVGPMRAAASFMQILSESNLKLRCELYGSLSDTGRGHGTDKAIMLGFMGYAPETVEVDKIDAYLDNVNQTHTIINRQREYFFSPVNDIIFQPIQLPKHPNGMRFSALTPDGDVVVQQTIYSVGGGFIVAHEDFDQISTPEDVVLPFAFDHADELLDLCQQHQLSVSELMLQNELCFRSESESRHAFEQIWQVMQACVNRGMHTTGLLPGGLNVKRRANALYQKLLNRQANAEIDPLDVMDWVNLYALAVNEENAAGGRVVTAPTNGAAGIIPAVLHYAVNFKQSVYPDGVFRFFLAAGAIASVIKKNASISGADVGCQGEVGSACSMAAAGLVEYFGGSAMQVESAAEIAMEHNLGLTCDPIGGLVQIPCIERNAIASVKAINAARMAMNDEGEHFVSLDKAIKTMRITGQDMNSIYKETSKGGLAVNVVAC